MFCMIHIELDSYTQHIAHAAESQIRTETPFYMATSSFQNYFLTFRINSAEVYVESSIRIELISYIALAVNLTARSTYTNTPLKTRTFLTSFGDWYSTG